MKSKALKRAYAALLSIMLIIGLLPTAVFAANTATVKINGQEMQDGVPVQCGEGTAVFDVQSNTLTLDNATIIESSTEPVLRLQGYGESLTINLIGTNKITSTSENYFPIYIDNADVTIQGTNTDTLTLESNSDSLSGSFCNLTIDGCTLDVTSHNWGGISTGNGEILIKNNADVTVDSYDPALWGENGIQIADSSLYATGNGDVNTLTSYGGDISISNSTVEAKGTYSTLYPAIYAFGDINITNKSNVLATSSGARGIFTDSNMTVTDSTVTATGTTKEGMVVVGALSLTNSKLTASSKPNDIIPAIVTKNFNVTNSEVTAKGGFNLLDWNEGNTDGISLSITPAEGKLAEFKVDGNNWDGSAAVHFKEGQKSPYAESVNFTADEMNWLGAYRYIHIGEHIHTGGTATCTEPAKCEDCGRAYGTAAGHNFEHGTCTVCGAADPDYVPPTPVYIYYDITASAGEGGTITPDGNSRVLRGTDKTFTITPDRDYVVSDVLVDGKSAGAVTSYTFETVREDHSIQVLFELSEEAKEAIRNEKLKKGVESTTIRLRSTLGNGFIRLDWEKSAGYKVDYYEVYKSTKRYSGYGTEPYFETKQGGLTGWYKNTKELKKGTRYYYKVRGVREIAGETVYTKWSTKAWRLVK